MRMLIGLMLLLLGLPAVAAPATAPPVAPRIEAILAALEPAARIEGQANAPQSLTALMRARNVPGVSIALIENGRIAWTGAYGTTDGSRRVTRDTLFQAASISKPIAATMALALVQRGVLALDRPVNAALTSWRIPDNAFTATTPVTLRHLLTHSGGLNVHGFPGYAAGEPLPTLVQILDGVAPANNPPIRVEQRPGTSFSYSGGGFMIAQLLMTDATSETFPALADRLVLRPLRMRRSSFSQPLPEARASEAAIGHHGDGTPVDGGNHVYPELAAAGLWTIPADLARWALSVAASFNGGTAGPLSPVTARAMLTPGLGGYGLGVQVAGEGDRLVFMHGGANEGFRAQLLLYPRSGNGIVIMTNGDNGGEVIQAVMLNVGSAFGWPAGERRTIRAVAISPQALADTIGHYAANGVSVAVTADRQRLTITIQNGPSFEFLAQGNDAFLSTNGGIRAQFSRDEAGRIVSLNALGMTLNRVPAAP
jgi:CubicO group peptidase (beta-lactamase class C family)